VSFRAASRRCGGAASRARSPSLVNWMIDSTPTASGAVVDEGTTRRPKPVVESDAGREAKEACQDALTQAGHGTRPVALQGEQVLCRLRDRLDALADRRQVRSGSGLGLARRAHHSGAEGGHRLGQPPAGVALVADEQLTVAAAARQQLEADLTPITLRRGQGERPRRAVGAQRACRRRSQKECEWKAQQP